MISVPSTACWVPAVHGLHCTCTASQPQCMSTSLINFSELISRGMGRVLARVGEAVFNLHIIEDRMTCSWCFCIGKHMDVRWRATCGGEVCCYMGLVTVRV